jgi:rare lipoprotein A
MPASERLDQPFIIPRQAVDTRRPRKPAQAVKDLTPAGLTLRASAVRDGPCQACDSVVDQESPWYVQTRREGTKVVWASAQVSYCSRMRRLAFFLGMLSLLSACSGKRGPEFEGLASYYAEPHHGRRTANGEVFDTYRAMTAAHRTLPFNTVVRVENKVNGKEVDVRINDRGPFIKGRIIDLSLRAARAINMVRAGVVPVKLKIVSQGTVPQRTASGTPLNAIQDDAFENLYTAEDLGVSLDTTYERATQ